MKVIKYLDLPEETDSASDPEKALELATDPEGVPLNKLVSRAVQAILDGEQVDDRSSSMAMALKEIIGWANWLRQNNVPTSTEPLDIANRVFYAIYEYSSELDGKFRRILNSINSSDTLEPAVVLSSDEKELAAWKKVRASNKQVYEATCRSN
jgi:hypothetical protein